MRERDKKWINWVKHGKRVNRGKSGINLAKQGAATWID